MSEQNTIALICDCDGTLCPDTTGLLISRIGGKPDDFWRDVYKAVEKGWDPPIAYMTKLLELARSKSDSGITLNILKEVGQSVSFSPEYWILWNACSENWIAMTTFTQPVLRSSFP